MLSTVEFFDLIRHLRQLPSDNQLAKLLNVSAGLISKHRSRPFGMDNELALRVAEILDYEPGFVLLCAAYERAKCTAEKEAFARLAGLALAHARTLQRGAVAA